MPAKTPSPTPPPPVRAGIGGWQFAPWRGGAFYPAGLPQKEELAWASRHLSAIEINSSFYRQPLPAHYAAWRAATPEGFKFSLKAPRRIVQQRQLAHTGEEVVAFIGSGLAELGDRLGPIVWQFGPYKHFDAEDIGPFLALLPASVEGLPLQHVLEVRHASFMDPAFLALVRRHGVAVVGTDSAEYPSFFDLSGPLVYLRLMSARAEQPTGYTAAELAQWRDRAGVWAKGGEPAELARIAPAEDGPATPREVYVFFINGAKERAPAAAQAFLATGA